MDNTPRQAAAAAIVAALVAAPLVPDEDHVHTHDEPTQDLAAMRGLQQTPSVATTTVVGQLKVIGARRTGPPGTP